MNKHKEPIKIASTQSALYLLKVFEYSFSRSSVNGFKGPRHY